MALMLRDARDELPWWERGNFSAIPAPPGLVSNFVDPPSQTKWDVLTQAVCLTVATLLVAMRLYTKFKVLGNPGWDDYTSFLAWIGLVTLSVLCLEEDRHGNGRHIWDITGYQYTAYAKLNYVVQIIYNPTIFLTKASILLLYLRVFCPVRRTYIILHIVLWANFTFYLVGTFFEAFQCLPVEKAWLPLLQGHCTNQIAAQTASAALNTFSDFVILVVPIANVWGLQLYGKGRLGIVMIFGFGVFACVASIVRLVEFAQKPPIIEGAEDVTWVYYSLNLVSVAEVTCGIICGCLPAFPAFARHVAGIKIKIIVSTRDRRGSTLSSWTKTTRSPLPNMTQNLGGLQIGFPLPMELKKPPPPSYSSVKSTSPTAIERGGKGSQHHPWEELDELEYVVGDDERPTLQRVKAVGLRKPGSPLANQRRQF